MNAVCKPGIGMSAQQTHKKAGGGLTQPTTKYHSVSETKETWLRAIRNEVLIYFSLFSHTNLTPPINLGRTAICLLHQTAVYISE